MATLGKVIPTPTDIMTTERERDHTNGYRHLMPHLRIGKMSFEAFAREKRERIPADHDYDIDVAHGLEVDQEVEADNYAQAEEPAKSKRPKKRDDKEVVAKARARKKGGA